MRRLKRFAAPIGYASTVALFGGLVWRSGPVHVASALNEAAFSLVLLAVALSWLGQMIMALKWWRALSDLGVAESYWRLLGLNLAGQLWNLLIPGHVGSEVYRGGRLAAGGVGLLPIGSAAIIDRLTNVLATALVGVAAVILLNGSSLVAQTTLGLAMLVLAPALCYVLLRQSWLARLLRAVARVASRRGRHAAPAEAVTWVLEHPGELASYQGLALLAQLVAVLSLVACAYAFAIPLSMPQVGAALIASSFLPYLLPVPGATLAIQQGGFLYLVIRMGASPDHASALAITTLAVVLLFGAIGAVLEGNHALRQRRVRLRSAA
ncbi:MAG: lysylphosphatidylglycerol synthase transmembrane domain-containing protein [Dehalococcoidia bacterium]